MKPQHATWIKKAKTQACQLLREDGQQSGLSGVVSYGVIAMICLNIVEIIIESINWSARYAAALSVFRVIFFVFFLAEYLLRLWIADDAAAGGGHPLKSRVRYVFSFTALINLLALLPIVRLGVTVLDFRIFRMLRLLRLSQFKSLRRYTNRLTKVLKLKMPQLLSAIFIVFAFMLASAVIIYNFENAAQPDKFNNILSCLWWSISAVTTIGYGDMYPITAAGRLFASFMSIFGVFLMAVPIAILTSGFLEVSRHGRQEERTSHNKM